MDKIELILKKLVSLRSFVPYEHEPFDFLNGFLKNLGFKVIKQLVSKNRFNILAERGVGKSSILFYMHLDTVLPARGFEKSSLKLRKQNDKFLGLGCFDMKGGIAALLSILDSIEFQNKKIKLAFCIDEEGYSEGVYKLINSSFIKDVSIAFCPEACIVPNNWELPVMIVMGGRGRTVIEIQIPGRSVHGAEDIGGINAIDQAAIFVNNLSSFKSKSDLDMGRGTFFIRSIHCENEGLSIPDLATIEIDYQLIPGETPNTLVKSFQQFIDKLYVKNILDITLKDKVRVQLKPRQTPYILPYSISRNNQFVHLVEGISNSFYKKVSFDYTKSVADQNVLANVGIPIITVGPIGGEAHQAGEWVSIQSLQEVARFYKKIIGSIS